MSGFKSTADRKEILGKKFAVYRLRVTHAHTQRCITDFLEIVAHLILIKPEIFPVRDWEKDLHQIQRM